MITIKAHAHHRNGIAGAPFDVCIFKASGDWKLQKGEYLAIVFDAKMHTAVFDLQKLANGDIAFGSNSWRADNIDTELRKQIAERNHETETINQTKGSNK